MGLPISIDRVVTSDRTLVGDLVITRSVFYFFPTDTVSTGLGFHDKHTSRAISIALAEHVLVGVLEWAGLGLAAFGLLLREHARRTTNKSHLKKRGLWLEEDSSAALVARLDREIGTTGREARRIEEFSTSLPRPLRLEAAQVQRLQLSWSGRLTVFDRYERPWVSGWVSASASCSGCTLGGWVPN
jgi:hypothetical protein